MIPARFEHIAFGFILSGLMSCIVSGISTLRAAGWVDGLFGQWMSAWATSWPVAFTVLLIVAPIARKIVRRLVRDPD